jgi:hypothetical protein
MVVCPRVVPAVASPAVLIVAILVADDVHVTWFVASPVVLLPKVAVAVYCWVVLGLIVVFNGEMVRAVIVFEPGKKLPQPTIRPGRSDPIARNRKNASRLKYVRFCTAIMLSPMLIPEHGILDGLPQAK